jgi:hypothetical protein
MSVDDYAVRLLDIQVRQLEPDDGFQRQRHCFVDFFPASAAAEILPNLPKRPEHLSSIESLSRAMVAEVRHSHLRL